MASTVEVEIFINKTLLDFSAAAADALSLIVDDSFSLDGLPAAREKALYALNILAHSGMIAKTINNMRDQHGNKK